MTDTEAGLLRAVLDDPASDLPRLVLADYWEENGQTERGEFVRVQCELARAEEAGCPGQTPEGARVNALRRRDTRARSSVRAP